MAERTVDPRVGRTTWKGSLADERPSWAWILQAITGVLLVVLLGVHMIANHFIVSRGLRDFSDVVAYLSNPIVVVWEVVFLAVVTWHGLLGLRAILFDFGFSPRTERRITVILTVVGVVAVFYGLWLTSVIVSHT
jgi:succinate dehydrogenase / fumarate reductase, membrane anchor subunit